jgi:hypothetical protein
MLILSPVVGFNWLKVHFQRKSEFDSEQAMKDLQIILEAVEKEKAEKKRRDSMN